MVYSTSRFLVKDGGLTSRPTRCCSQRTYRLDPCGPVWLYAAIRRLPHAIKVDMMSQVDTVIATVATLLYGLTSLSNPLALAPLHDFAL